MLQFAVILVLLYNMKSTFRVDFVLFARSKIKEFSWSSGGGWKLQIMNNLNEAEKVANKLFKFCGIKTVSNSLGI